MFRFDPGRGHQPKRYCASTHLINTGVARPLTCLGVETADSRMRRYLALILVAFSLGLNTGLSQNPFEPDTHIACVERLQAPVYSAVARQVKAEGTITASVILTSSASIHEITTDFKSKTRRAIGLLIPLVEKSIVGSGLPSNLRRRDRSSDL